MVMVAAGPPAGVSPSPPRGGIRVGRKRVEWLMRQQGWHGAFLRRGWRGGSTKQDPRHTPAPDLVNRDFTAAAPNRLWIADATRIPCGEGVFWLAAVRDAFSNRIVGWKTSDRCDTAVSSGRRESSGCRLTFPLSQHLARALVVEAYTWPVVELGGDLVELVTRPPAQIASLG